MSTRKYRSNTQWIEILQQYIKSGLTPKKYCQQKSLDYKYFLKRKRAFDEEQPVSSKRDSFVKVKSPPKLKISPPVSLILQYQNSQLHFTEGTDAQWLAQLMKALS